jgi:hypothetical protein
VELSQCRHRHGIDKRKPRIQITRFQVARDKGEIAQKGTARDLLIFGYGRVRGGISVTLKPKLVFAPAIVCVFLSISSNLYIEAQDAHFHNAPVSSAQQKNPYTGQHAAIVEGGRLYTRNCGACHGIGGREAGIRRIGKKKLEEKP